MSLTAELAATYCIELIVNRLMMMVSFFTLPSPMPRLYMEGMYPKGLISYRVI